MSIKNFTPTLKALLNFENIGVMQAINKCYQWILWAQTNFWQSLNSSYASKRWKAKGGEQINTEKYSNFKLSKEYKIRDTPTSMHNNGDKIA